MGATGRKLTIRMPDNPRLRTAEVGKVHLDPGARVQSGNPVLTLVNRRKEHLVRSPRSGRVVPLIAPGDRVNGGDPLYILHIDEAALEEKNREERAMIAVEREKWTSGVLADAIEPIRRDKVQESEGSVPEFVANWGKPVLALALYVLACFALLPILHLFGQTASTPVLIAMVIGCIAFAALIFYLYAPDSGRWPRWTVRMVAISWVGISSAALFYRPDNPNDITIDNAIDGAIAPVASLFAPTDEKPLAPPPQETVVPVAVAQSGVAVGPTEAVSTPTQSEPRTILAAFEGQIIPHGVQVREWGRVNPRNDSGDVLMFDARDVSPLPSAEAVPVLLASTDGARFAEDAPKLPEGLAAAPKRAERQADIVMAAIPQVRDTELFVAPSLDALELRDENAVSLAVFTDRVAAEDAELDATVAQSKAGKTLVYGDAQTMLAETLPVLRGEQAASLTPTLQTAAIPDFSTRLSGTANPGLVSAQPGQVRTPALNLASSLRTGDADWAENQLAALEVVVPSGYGVVPVPEAEPSTLRDAAQTSGVAAPEAVESVPLPFLTEGEIILSESQPIEPILSPDAPLQIAGASATARVSAEPVQVTASRSPALILIGAVRAGEADWMFDQSERLAGIPATAQTFAGEDVNAQAPIALASVSAEQLADAPGIASLNDGIGVARDFGMAVLPVLDGAPSAPVTFSDAPDDIRITRLVPFDTRNVPTVVGASSAPGKAPSAPPLQPELMLAERDLLYLYFDDPRILSHPQVGDPWQGLVSPQLASAIERTEVVEVYEMLQVQNWCAAANDPDGSKRAELGDAYTTAYINDRIRLLRVRLSVDETALDQLESEIPLFDGSPAGFFHNKAPLLAGLPEDSLVQKGRDYLRSLSAGIFDPNAPDAIGGGQYFDNPVAVSVILQGAGCDQASLNDGAGAANEIGRALEARLGG